MRNDNLKLKIILSISMIFVLAFSFFALLDRGDGVQAAPLDSFAQCLTEKNVTMYGSATCSHCLNEKKLFGDSFQYVRYVECMKQPNVCVAAGIEGVPTWVLGDGRNLVGEQGLQGLANVTGCELPTVEQ